MTTGPAFPKRLTTTNTLELGPGMEPDLEDMLTDPIIQLVMKRDGIGRADVERVLDQTRVRLMAARLPSGAAAA